MGAKVIILRFILMLPARMITSAELYGITTLVLLSPWLVLWIMHGFTIIRMVLLLFILDMVLTVEAAFYSDIILIAILHVITIPALFALIYFDLIKEHKSQFHCFICSRQIETHEAIATIKRTEHGTGIQMLVHSSCIQLEAEEKKSISERIFRRGIPN